MFNKLLLGLILVLTSFFEYQLKLTKIVLIPMLIVKSTENNTMYSVQKDLSSFS